MADDDEVIGPDDDLEDEEPEEEEPAELTDEDLDEEALEEDDEFVDIDDPFDPDADVVDEEEDDAAAIERHRTFQVDGGKAASGCELALFITARRDHFKSFDRVRLAVDAQFEVFFRQSIDEVALLVENHHVGLDEFGVNAYNLIRRFWRCLRGGFGTRQARAQEERK